MYIIHMYIILMCTYTCMFMHLTIEYYAQLYCVIFFVIYLIDHGSKLRSNSFGLSPCPSPSASLPISLNASYNQEISPTQSVSHTYYGHVLNYWSVWIGNSFIQMSLKCMYINSAETCTYMYQRALIIITSSSPNYMYRYTCTSSCVHSWRHILVCPSHQLETKVLNRHTSLQIPIYTLDIY